MKDENTYIIHGWMRNKLNLSGHKLTLFAIIWGFSQDGKSQFRGSISYINSWIGCTTPTAIKTKKLLVKEGLIIEKEHESGNLFSVNLEKVAKLRSKETLVVGTKETLEGGVKKLYRGTKETLVVGTKETLDINNNYNNKDNNKDKIKNFQYIRMKTLSDKWKKWQMYFANENQKELVLDWLTYLTYVGKSYTTAHPVMAIRSKLDEFGFEAVKKAMNKAKESEAKSFDWALEKKTDGDKPVFKRKGKK